MGSALKKYGSNDKSEKTDTRQSENTGTKQSEISISDAPFEQISEQEDLRESLVDIYSFEKKVQAQKNEEAKHTRTMTYDSVEEPKMDIPQPQSLPVLSPIIEPETLYTDHEALKIEEQNISSSRMFEQDNQFSSRDDKRLEPV